mmetsp:Transcript_12159/g.35211  ORF Transcript_12159/g.35211 Transcript_12159/m.35211 type:complete len:241 (-) Transcript_12159:292-1014(-)
MVSIQLLQSANNIRRAGRSEEGEESPNEGVRIFNLLSLRAATRRAAGLPVDGCPHIRCHPRDLPTQGCQLARPLHLCAGDSITQHRQPFRLCFPCEGDAQWTRLLFLIREESLRPRRRGSLITDAEERFKKDVPSQHRGWAPTKNKKCPQLHRGRRKIQHCKNPQHLQVQALLTANRRRRRGDCEVAEFRKEKKHVCREPKHGQEGERRASLLRRTGAVGSSGRSEEEQPGTSQASVEST